MLYNILNLYTTDIFLTENTKNAHFPSQCNLMSTNTVKKAHIFCGKNLYKHRFIPGSAKCSILFTKLLTHIKQGPQKYCKLPILEVG